MKFTKRKKKPAKKGAAMRKAPSTNPKPPAKMAGMQWNATKKPNY